MAIETTRSVRFLGSQKCAINSTIQHNTILLHSNIHQCDTSAAVPWHPTDSRVTESPQAATNKKVVQVWKADLGLLFNKVLKHTAVQHAADGYTAC